MRYTSTRNKDVNVSFEDAITLGYSTQDGGLFVPKGSLPQISTRTLCEWIGDDTTGSTGSTGTSSMSSRIQSYSQLMYNILRMFIDPIEVSDDELRMICNESVQGFEDPISCIPVIPLQEQKQQQQQQDTNTNNNNYSNSSSKQQQQQRALYVAELFHGPTFCFKDLGMRTVIQLLYLFTKKRHLKLQQQSTTPTSITTSTTLLVSTTGDTGPAAAQTIYDINDPMMNIIVHYPYEQISSFQQEQLLSLTTTTTKTSTTNTNHLHDHLQQQQQQQQHRHNTIQVVAFHGGGDDMDLPIKNLLTESKNAINNESTNTSSSSLSSLWTGVNSYNIGRPITQTIFYIWTYICIARDQQWLSNINIDDIEDSNVTAKDVLPMIDIVLPTGAMGNIVAGYISQMMGLPIHTFVAAVNANDIMYQTINYGKFYKTKQPMIRTLSEAINIQIPYNFERMIYYITNENDTIVKEYYTNLEGSDTGKIHLPDEYLMKIQSLFRSARVTDEQMCTSIRTVYSNYNQYIIDPHTAVAFSAAYQLDYIQQNGLILSNDNNMSLETTTTTSSRTGHNDDTNTLQKLPVVILATASPCKFQEAVSIALGTEVWDKYVNNYNQMSPYPQNANIIMERSNINDDGIGGNGRFHHYTNPNQLPLSDIQKVWEDRTRKLIYEMERMKQ